MDERNALDYIQDNEWHHQNLSSYILSRLFDNTDTPLHHFENAASLGLSLDRIRNPPQGRNLECYVVIWAVTAFHLIFREGCWTFTPEQVDQHTRKKPDMVIEMTNSSQGGFYL